MKYSQQPIPSPAPVRHAKSRLAVWLLGLCLCAGLLAGCDLLPPTTPPGDSDPFDSIPTAANPFGGPVVVDTPIPGEQTDWYQVYFTDPDAPNANRYRGGPDEELAAAIDQARLSVDVAIFDLNLWSIRDALLAAHERGVTVRVVTETDNLDEPEIAELKAAGIPVIDDRQEGLMHNKFTIIDRRDIWTGSLNYTTSEGYRNNNNLIHITSADLAANYLAEFEEMFSDRRFGAEKQANTPDSTLTIGGTPVEIYFSPTDGAARRVEQLLLDAKREILVLAFSFTADDLADALLDSAQEGVAVRGVFEESQVISNTGGDYERLRQAGLNVHLDGNQRNMHNKVFIIDGEIVITGSYNFSSSAARRNDENLLIIFDPQLAAIYQAEFERLFAEAQP